MVPVEPVDLLEALRAEAASDPAAARAELPERVAAYAFDAWGPALEARGLDRAAVVEVARAFGRELWLWIAGERTWEQSGTALAGRLARRAS